MRRRCAASASRHQRQSYKTRATIDAVAIAAASAQTTLTAAAAAARVERAMQGYKNKTCVSTNPVNIYAGLHAALSERR